MARPNYITCIIHTHNDLKRLTWCGRYVAYEFVFQNIDHAVYNKMNENSLETCKSCVKKMYECLKNGNRKNYEEYEKYAKRC